MPTAANQLQKTDTWAATTAMDFSANKDHLVVMAGTTTLTFTGCNAGDLISVWLTQDATGSRTCTFPATVKWAGGSAPTLTTTASKSDHFYFHFDGTNYYEVQQKLNF